MDNLDRYHRPDPSEYPTSEDIPRIVDSPDHSRESCDDSEDERDGYERIFFIRVNESYEKCHGKKCMSGWE